MPLQTCRAVDHDGRQLVVFEHMVLRIYQS